MRFFLFGPRLFGLHTGVSFKAGELWKQSQVKNGAVTGSFVYVVDNGRGNHKVGWTVNPTARLATLQTGSPDALRFAYVAAASGKGFEIEQAAHEILANHRGSGEWFAIPADMAVAALNTAAFRSGENLLQVTPAQADEILKIAASTPHEAARKRVPAFVYFLGGFFVIMGFAEYRMFGEENLWPIVIGNGVAAAILLPAFAKFG